MSASGPQDVYRSGIERTVRIVVTTGNEIAGHRTTEVLGIVRGIVVRSPTLGQGILGAFKSIGGGNIREYADVCEAARHDAYVQMVQHAEQLGAHAIIGMRYDATEFRAGVTEVLGGGSMNGPATSRFFLCCPLCGHRMPRDWLARAATAFRRWGFVLSYPGRRQIRKVGEIYVSTTPPEQARLLIGEAGEALAALASALVFELSVAGWRPAWLRALGVELIRRRVVEPVVEYVDRVAPPAQQACVAQPCGPVRWAPVSPSAAAPPIVESRPAAPRAAPCGPIRWEVIKPRAQESRIKGRATSKRAIHRVPFCQGVLAHRNPKL